MGAKSPDVFEGYGKDATTVIAPGVMDWDAISDGIDATFRCRLCGAKDAPYAVYREVLINYGGIKMRDYQNHCRLCEGCKDKPCP